MKPKTLLFAATLVAACANITPPTAAEAEQIAQARAQLQTEPDRAGDAADALLRANPNLREARLLLAESSMQMARQGYGNAQHHMIDARRYFRQALDATEAEDFPAQWRMLAECHYELFEFEEGSAAAAMAAKGFESRPGQQNKIEWAKARLIGARCNMQLFVKARSEERNNGEKDRNGIVPPSSETLALAATTAGAYRDARPDHPGEATRNLAQIFLWLDQQSEAEKEFEGGLLATPDVDEIHTAYMQWMIDNGRTDLLAAAYRGFVRKRSDAPVLRWYHGRAVFTRADSLRREGNFQGAIAIYQKARAVFTDYLAVMPQHRANTEQMQALCDLSMARCSTDTGDLDKAIEYLFRADATSKVTAQYIDGQAQLRDSEGNHFIGVAFAIHVALTQQPENALRDTLAFNEKLLEKHPDRWGFLYNNAALAARDLGVQISNEQREDEAMQLWERSYQHYVKAVELSPNDARTVNDCGLMLIYHLHRDLDHARSLFDRAIELGTQQLAEMDENTASTERENLEEAVGDAWQNIAVLLREHKKAPFDEYKRFCEEAIKYYPYQRREAAQLLRQKGEQNLGSTARSVLANRLANASAQQGGGADALKAAMPKIQEKLDGQDYDGALTLLDKLSKECKSYAPYHFLRGKTTWQLANQSRDNKRKGTEFFYKDAVSALTKAVELDAEPVEPRLMLGQAQYDAGDIEAANKTATKLMLHMQSQGGSSPEHTIAVHTLRANTAARTYIKTKGNGEEDKNLLSATRTSLRLLESKDKLDAGLLKLWSDTELWAGAPAQAVSVYVRAAERNPADFTALEQIVNIANTQKQLPLAVEALSKRNDAGTLWYLGKAQFLNGGALRVKGKVDDSVAAVEAARKSFEQSMQKNAGYKDSCEQWIAMCIGKLGNIALSRKQIDEAEKLLLDSLKRRPDRIHDDLGLGETTKRGLLGVVNHYYKKNDLKMLEQISRAASDAAPGDVDFANNAGLFARDYGNALERGGKKAAADEMYEQSYKAYRRAHQLDPANVRLRNDCALIAIYHLERDWDECKALLESAIKDGDETLKNNPPDDETEKQNLEEAVGDCYENLALWHLKHKRDGKAAKEAANNSMRYYPKQRRGGARRHLQAAERLLQGN